MYLNHLNTSFGFLEKNIREIFGIFWYVSEKRVNGIKYIKLNIYMSGW